MRKLVIVALVSAACGRGSANGDSAAMRDSLVAGPAAVPATLTPTDSAGSLPKGAQPKAPAAPPQPPSRSGQAVAAEDSTLGTVSIVGTSFDKRVVVSTATPQRRLTVTGPLAVLIGRVAGAEVAVRGPVAAQEIEARSFTVRTVDGKPAIDGTLRTEGGALYIVTATGTKTRIATPPPPLMGRDGARVWITGDPASAVASWGFIDPPG